MTSAKLNDEIKTILITGGSGLVGTRLSRRLTDLGYEVTHLSRSRNGDEYATYVWDIPNNTLDKKAIETADAIIHLAGAGVADQRWNEERKKEIYDSRIDSTRLLCQAVKAHKPDLKYFLSASAIGYYGWDTGERVIDESSEKGEGFLADVVEDWEKEAGLLEEQNIPVGKVRIGVVLSEKGGALQEIAKPIRFGAGAALGSGKQYLSWIHVDDLCGIFIHMLENRIQSTVNGVAPNPVTNKELTTRIAKKLKRPLLLPNVPKFALKALVGEMAVMLIGGNNISSKRIEELGYSFQYPELNSALSDLL